MSRLSHRVYAPCEALVCVRPVFQAGRMDGSQQKSKTIWIERIATTVGGSAPGSLSGFQREMRGVA